MDQPEVAATDTTAAPVASTPAEQPFDGKGTNALDVLSSEQRSDWLKTGKLPETVSTNPAASSPAKPVDQAVSTDPTTADASKPSTPQKSNADTRKAQIAAEIKADLERRDAIRREVAEETRRLTALRQPATPEGAASKPHTAVDPNDPRPKVDDFENYDDFTEATARWAFRQEHQSVQASERERTQREQLTRSQSERAQKFTQQIDEAKSGDPEFLSKVSDDVLSLRPFSALLPGETPNVTHAIAEELLNSPVATQLMLHWTAHPDEFRALTAVKDPRELIRRIGATEARLERASATETKPAAKHVTTATAPVTTLGTKQSGSIDPIAQALKDGDVTEYRRLVNQREERALAANRR